MYCLCDLLKAVVELIKTGRLKCLISVARIHDDCLRPCSSRGAEGTFKVLRGFTKVTGQARQMAREFTRSLEMLQ